MKSKPFFKMICLLLVFIVVLGVMYGTYKCQQKSLDLSNCGTLRLPRSWNEAENAGLVVFSGNHGTPTMVQYMYTNDINPYSSDLRSTIRTIMDGSETTGTLEITQSTIYSNSASYGTAQITIDGVSMDVRIIELYGYDRNHIASNMYFYCSDSLSDFTLRQIAKSFRHN